MAITWEIFFLHLNIFVSCANKIHLIALHQSRLIDQTLVDVEGGHVVDDDGALEVLVVVLGLEDVLKQGGLARPEEAAEQGDGNQAVVLSLCCLWKQIS